MTIRACLHAVLAVLPGLTLLHPTVRAGAQQPDDSLAPAAVYVPAACTAAHRCPLVVFPQVPANIARSLRAARAMIDWQRALAEQYGMILLVLPSPAIPESRDTLLQQTLHNYPVDPTKVALTGDWLQSGCADPTVFSRVALLSPALIVGFPPVCLSDGPPPRPVRVYLSGGLGEPSFVSQTVRNAVALQEAGHTVEAGLVLRGYDAGRADFDRIWRWLSASWTSAAPAPAPSAADSGPLLTVRALQQLTTFWTRFQQAPESIRTTARLAHQQRLTVPIEGVRFTLSLMDTPALAARYPAVRAALAAAGLTAGEADAYRRALLFAVTHRPGRNGFASRPPLAAGTRLGQNVAFLQAPAHKDALKALGATGMWLTP